MQDKANYKRQGMLTAPIEIVVSTWPFESSNASCDSCMTALKQFSDDSNHLLAVSGEAETVFLYPVQTIHAQEWHSSGHASREQTPVAGIQPQHGYPARSRWIGRYLRARRFHPRPNRGSKSPHQGNPDRDDKLVLDLFLQQPLPGLLWYFDGDKSHQKSTSNRSGKFEQYQMKIRAVLNSIMFCHYLSAKIVSPEV